MSGPDPHASIERLDAYERGLDGGADLDAYEEELFARALDGDAPELSYRDSLGASVHAMGARGTIEPFPSAEQVAALRARTDLRVAYVDLGAQTRGGRVVTPPDADVVITRVAVDTTDVERIDVEVGFEGTAAIKTMPDVKFDRADGAVYFCCEGSLARSIMGVPFGRFWSIHGDRRTLLAEFVVAVS